MFMRRDKNGDVCIEPPPIQLRVYKIPTVKPPILHSPHLSHKFVSATSLDSPNTMQLFSIISPFLATFHSQFVIPIPILLFCSFFLVLLLLQWHHPRHKRLPPGSMGWPYIGETLKLYTENPNSFFANRQKRYTN